MNTLFFHPRFVTSLNWPGPRSLRLGAIGPENKQQITAGLKDLSSTSIRNRFLGSKKEFTEQELEYLTHLDGLNHFALGIEEAESKRGIAIIRMVRSSTDPREAEVAITIIDEYQRKGLGTMLILLMILAAKERNIERLSFTFFPGNEGILRLIKKAGHPLLVRQDHDSIQLCLSVKDYETEDLKQKLKALVPEIEKY